MRKSQETLVVPRNTLIFEIALDTIFGMFSRNKLKKHRSFMGITRINARILCFNSGIARTLFMEKTAIVKTVSSS